ncbi:xanthine dehydrogenase accessory protein XdhC [Gynuella sunshinyii]|uniref:Xanthine and CO dehydrogenase maturation factor, XdhC/CoxF family n=1 Tax=Gynuella sunshinyii YC6258 TaxID=1445510 RepID=A0A0C5VCB1_9GAMM|nr:xanthine dehydrogenase accessory protein XdhC [Gynuella sunshinyii]AJQ92137.1 xanthine and CO dehydrogenase maturation factor, XdhC/CoxF family [Gynuella sunshinyii YC6258]
MNKGNWITALAETERKGVPAVLVTILQVVGSSPRDGGTKMVITDCEAFDTIGGGHLEWQVVEQARQMLLAKTSGQQIVEYNLAADLGQCCGGAVRVLFEPLRVDVPVLSVFGAGHVAQALMPLLEPLPLAIRWLDGRADQLYQNTTTRAELVLTDDPVNDLILTNPRHWILVLTHNHQLDYQLVEQALKQDNVEYLGVIGSQTKARRFRQRLEHRGYSQQNINRMICPVGVQQIPGKKPYEVAISIVAQLLQLLNGGIPTESEYARSETAVSGSAKSTHSKQWKEDKIWMTGHDNQ